LSGKPRDGWVWSLWSQVRDKRSKRMRVAEALPLGGKRSLVLVECDGQAFLVGCGHDQVNCIVPAPRPSRPAALAMVDPWSAKEEPSE
jgi:flagellar biogenesis protein FliO